MKEALRYSAALLGELRTSLLRWAHTALLCGPPTAMRTVLARSYGPR